MCVDVILSRATVETRWTQKNSCESLQLLIFSFSEIEIGVPHFVSCCVSACELLGSVPGAFFVWVDHTYKVDSCIFLHGVFTVQQPTVATVA